MHESNAVCVWRVHLDRADPGLRAQLATLAPDEVVRAGRFIRAEDRTAFVTTRSALRSVLARQVGVSPSELKIEYGETGKPRLAKIAELQFNVSHSGRLAVIAVGIGAQLGIDVEFRKSPVPHLDEDVFSQEESGHIRSAADPLAAFYDHWTCKEALIKGKGASLATASEFVPIRPGAPELVAGFHLQNFAVGADFSAALAVEYVPMTACPSVVCRDFHR